MNTDSNSAWTVNNNVVMQWSSNYDDDDWNGVEMPMMTLPNMMNMSCSVEMMTSDDCNVCINLKVDIWLILISKCSQNYDYEL